jgi:hypothetical protein
VRRPPTELGAWMAVAEVLEVPADLARLMAELTRATEDLERVTDQLHELKAAPAVSSRLAAGVDAEVAVAEAAKADERFAVVSEAVSQVASFQRSREMAVRRWIGDHRSDLIATTLNAKVAELLEDSAPLVAKLERFAPAFTPRELVSSATPAELAAWRKLTELDETFALVLATFMHSWRVATSSAGSPGRDKFPGWLRPSRAGGLHVWEAPELVDDLDVAYGVERRLAAVTWWHVQGGRYRLATARDLLALNRTYELEHPWGGRSQIAGVLVLGASRFEDAERKRVRFVAL